MGKPVANLMMTDLVFSSLTLRTNVHARIKRMMEHNHGHPYMWIVDKIQLKLMELFSFCWCSNHVNVSCMANTNFSPIGIGPLSYDSRYVDCGQPSPKLKGDLRYVANKMGLVFPLLPISTREEYKLFTNHISKITNDDEVGIKQMTDLAIKYKLSSDGEKIFPKLPSMLLAYYKTWKVNQKLKMLRLQLDAKFKQVKEIVAFSQATAPETKPLLEPDNISFVVQQELPSIQIYVPTTGALNQKQDVPVSTNDNTDDPKPIKHIRQERQCAWAPFCMRVVSNCGGISRESCSIYGKNGILGPTDPPKPSEELFKIEHERHVQTRRNDEKKRKRLKQT